MSLLVNLAPLPVDSMKLCSSGTGLPVLVNITNVSKSPRKSISWMLEASLIK